MNDRQWESLVFPLAAVLAVLAAALREREQEV